MIEYVELMKFLLHAEVSKSQFPGSIGYMSDHCVVYLDIKIEPIHGITLHQPVSKKKPLLKSEKKNKGTEYADNLLMALKESNIPNRAAQLWTQVINGEISTCQQQGYEDLNR